MVLTLPRCRHSCLQTRLKHFGPVAAKWVETCGVFVAQVKRVLAAIEKPV